MLTGVDAVTGADGQVLPDRVPNPFETSVRGAFAVGDVRAGSVKRVGGAIGDGAAAVALIHQHLAALDAKATRLTRDGGRARPHAGKRHAA